MLTRTARRAAHAQEGAAAVEFALIAPLLILLFFGIVQFGITIFRAQVIEASAREAARVASVGGTAAEIEAAADDAAPGFTDAEVTSAFVQVAGADDDCGSIGDDTSVVVTASGSRLNFEIPFFGSFTPNFSSTATFRCEAVTP